MTKEEYMEEHHQITESYLGLISVYLKNNDIVSAKAYIEKCKKELDVIFEIRKQTFLTHLQDCRKEVETWPEWKQKL